ncbi:hypothetical protein [Williamsia sp. R60]
MSAVTGGLALAVAIAIADGEDEFARRAATRLPWERTLLAALALALVVGIPMLLSAYTLWRCTPHAAATTFISGALLVTWIAVQMTADDVFHPLQLVFGVIGLFLMATGWHLGRGHARV